MAGRRMAVRRAFLLVFIGPLPIVSCVSRQPQLGAVASDEQPPSQRQLARAQCVSAEPVERVSDRYAPSPGACPTDAPSTIHLSRLALPRARGPPSEQDPHSSLSRRDRPEHRALQSDSEAPRDARRRILLMRQRDTPRRRRRKKHQYESRSCRRLRTLRPAREEACVVAQSFAGANPSRVSHVTTGRSA